MYTFILNGIILGKILYIIFFCFFKIDIFFKMTSIINLKFLEYEENKLPYIMWGIMSYLNMLKRENS